jgi:hypothetical protein
LGFLKESSSARAFASLVQIGLELSGRKSFVLFEEGGIANEG